MTYLRRKWDAIQLNDVSILHNEILKSVAHRKLTTPLASMRNPWPGGKPNKAIKKASRDTSNNKK